MTGVWTRLRRGAEWIYPFLLAATPVLFLAAKNPLTVKPDQLVVPLLAALGLTAAVLAAGCIVLGSYARAAIAATVFVLLFFLAGNAYGLLANWVAEIPRWPVFLAALTLILASAYALSTYVSRRPAVQGATQTLFSVMAAVLFLNTVAQLLRGDTRRLWFADAEASGQGPSTVQPVRTAESAEFPDIYYIIADAYGRADALQREYGFDNRPFLRWLEQHNFAVADASWANYPTTFISLASSLSMAYVHEDPAAGTSGALDRRPFYRRIHAPEVAQKLRQKGYRYVQTLTNWGGTDRSALADVTYKFAPFLGNEFSSALANMTLLRALAPDLSALHHFVTDSAAQIPQISGPTFAFIHLLLPHHPFVFDATGRVIANVPLTLDFKLQKDAWRLREAYVAQLRYTNVLLMRMIESILAASSVPPVIILQGDHGSAVSSFASGRHGASDPRERLAILNAWHAPHGIRKRLYPSMTPVNTFRLLLSAQFGDDLPLLPDRSYYFSYDDLGGRDFRDVTALLQGESR